MSKLYRCPGSLKQGSACANQDLPEGVESCTKCTEANYDEAARTTAIEVEAERVKDLPADRVKKSQTIKLEQ